MKLIISYLLMSIMLIPSRAQLTLARRFGINLCHSQHICKPRSSFLLRSSAIQEEDNLGNSFSTLKNNYNHLEVEVSGFLLNLNCLPKYMLELE